MCALFAQQALRADALGVGARATALERASFMTGGATGCIAQLGCAASRHMRECAACPAQICGGGGVRPAVVQGSCRIVFTRAYGIDCQVAHRKP